MRPVPARLDFAFRECLNANRSSLWHLGPLRKGLMRSGGDWRKNQEGPSLGPPFSKPGARIATALVGDLSLLFVMPHKGRNCR